MRNADAIVKDMVDAILADLTPHLTANKHQEILLLVNGLGATPLMELYLVYNTAAKLFADAGLSIARSLVGNYTTAIDMAGTSITACLLDDEIKQHWDNPVHTPALRWGK
jgi:phosphoenolpyruvate---glycerone phosphotransferase subunit DhaK